MSKSIRNRPEAGPGQESVWDYPRPPIAEPSSAEIEVHFAGVLVAATTRSIRVLETSHPPVYYVPPDDITMEVLASRPRRSLCEWKGRAHYFSIEIGGQRKEDVAWSYPKPLAPYRNLANHVAFYPALMERCLVDGEVVEAQPGGFYGGWITSAIVGPFKGEPGTRSW